VADLHRIEDLRRRIQRDPASIAFAQLAEELRRAHEFEESVSVCRAGLEIHPEYLSARVTLGRALIELNQLDDAQSELERVLKSAPENLAALRGLGEIHQRRGEMREALAQYRAALALARNDPELEETVTRLSKEVEPQASAAASDLMSFDQIHHELLKLAPPPPPRAASVSDDAPSPVPASDSSASVEASDAALTAEDDAATIPIVARDADPTPEEAAAPPVADPAHGHAERTVAALEQWLEAIHVARADRSP
jgi:tetratricopeptide (TPR) repeat protein